MYKPNWIFCLFIFLLSIQFFACNDDFENYSNNPRDLLEFSTDTVSFDTVLTTVNSPVLAFRVYNRNAKPLLISSVRLAEGANSNFKINVDGMAGAVFENVEILANDSILVLVDVKPKESGKLSPELIIDYIIFETNKVQQKVVLEAFGQDVYVLRGVTLSSDSLLDNQKPYLIYDSLVIGAGATVEILEGSIFYMHNDAQLIVRGTIKVKGTIENPVVFRGSRTDDMVKIPYDLIPGQWGGIYFDPESYENEFENVRIRNGRYGMILDICNNPERNKLYMKNLVLTNFSELLLFSLNCNIIAENCEFSNSKGALLSLVGGSYEFTHCTIVNYYPIHIELGWGNSNNETLILSDAYILMETKEVFYFPVIKADFFNSIIWGAKPSQSAPDTPYSKIQFGNIDSTVILPFQFKNCLLTIEKNNDPRFVDCIFKENIKSDLLFRKSDPSIVGSDAWYPSFDFSLQKTSPAIGAANLKIAGQIPYDLYGFYRLTDGKPDLGAYEYHEKE